MLQNRGFIYLLALKPACNCVCMVNVSKTAINAENFVFKIYTTSAKTATGITIENRFVWATDTN